MRPVHQDVLDAVLDALAASAPLMDAALEELVNHNSFTQNRAGGDRVGEALASRLGVAGISAERVQSARFADHWVYRTEGEAGRGRIALVGHLDTVFPPGAFEGYRRDGALRRGPGVLDMKGGLIVVAFALRALAEAGALARLPALTFVVVSDEEVGSPEGREVIRRAVPGADAALVFESGRARDAVITRRKGTGSFFAHAKGVAAHAGNAHERGANALWCLARFVDAVQGLTRYDAGITVNVGRVVGGQTKNTVPDAGLAELDVRFCTQPEGEALVGALREAAARAAASVPGTSLAVEGELSRMPLEQTPESLALARAYGESARRVGLGFEEAPLIGGASDASTTSALGIPTIDGLGPRGAGFHTADEHIEVATLVQKAQALADFLVTAGLPIGAHAPSSGIV